MTTEKAPANRCDTPRIWTRALKEGGIAFLAAGVLLSIFYGIAFRWIHPEFVPFMEQGSSTIAASGNAFVPISMGKLRVADNAFIIESFNGDEAILAWPEVFRAEDYPFIQVKLEGLSRYSRAKLLWQKAGETAVNGLELNLVGDGVAQAAMVYAGDNYRGMISSLAILIFDGPASGVNNNSGSVIALHSLELRPFSPLNLAKQLVSDLLNPPLWGLHSANTVTGVHKNSTIFPNLCASLLLVLAITLIAVSRSIKWGPLRRRSGEPPMIYPVLMICLIVWVPSEGLRWIWRFEQVTDSIVRFSGKRMAEKITHSDLRCARYPDCAEKLLPYF